VKQKKLVLLGLTILIAISLTISISVLGTSDKPSLLTLQQGKASIIIGHTTYAAGELDYSCDGTDDNVQFQAALDALPSGGGKLVILAGNYSFSATVTRPIDNVVIQGVGRATNIAYNASSPVFTAGGNNWVFRDFATDAGGVSLGATTGWLKEDLLEGTSYMAFQPSGNITPSANNTYALGSDILQWKELFVAGGSIHLGETRLYESNGILRTDNPVYFDQNLTVSGVIKSTSPVKVEDGLLFVDDTDPNTTFHILISGLHSNTETIPPAFDNSLTFSTHEIRNAYNMEVVFWDVENARPALVLNEGGVGRASVFERSLIVGAQKGTKTLDGSYTLGTEYTNLDFNTSVSGADLGVEDDVEILGTLYADNIIGDIICVTEASITTANITTTNTNTINVDDINATNAYITTLMVQDIFTTGFDGYEVSTDPFISVEGHYKIWMSNGIGKGDDGDILIASKAGGVTKWAILFDHSASASW